MIGKTTNLNHRHSVGPNTTATIPVKVWHCPACTYENSSASVVCDICSSPRGLANSSKSSNDMSSLRYEGMIDFFKKLYLLALTEKALNFKTSIMIEKKMAEIVVELNHKLKL